MTTNNKLYRSFRSFALRFFVLVLVISNSACSDDFFDKNPLDAVSDATFWKSESDAKLALVGCYNNGGAWSGEDFWTPRGIIYLDFMAGFGSEKELIPDRFTDGTLDPSYWAVEGYWDNTYRKIVTCNNFLSHIDDIEMDATIKANMIAEVRTIRAYQYFNLSFFFSDVPLFKNVLTVDEANNIERTPKADIMNFVETELEESYLDLPLTRPISEDGRITSGATLAILGRVLMANKKWAAAAATYKKIIDSQVYTIVPNFRTMFNVQNEINTEFILTSQYQEDVYSHVLTQYLYPETYGGWHQFSPYNELVKQFECTDGLSIEDSPLFDPSNPYDNRDPRLDYTIMISDRTVFKGTTFVSRPDSSSPDRITRYNWSGYCINKFMDPTFSGNLMNYGGNWSIIRYAEVLLSYLESKLEAGDAIDQVLLDETINKVRSRADVNMPAITTTNTVELRNKIRIEREVEFAFEGLHYYDILRWGVAAEKLNRQFTGMKLTNDPANYTDFDVDEDGYLIYQKRNFVEGVNEIWPIPQAERNVNTKLTQNPGYPN
ncbi:SusD family protein [Mariniflexile rhizosphaerae]|uniref:RagB/SusD family nutrient uptake outer membrane protein n=1 Tax=unclassified Mariniflexile TaxID=2643887 RepID=UPI000E32FF70|nr:RagB/SusD family nutrient uptake outer membrane protein [Mariniflexile sp. TRM1-10]AXP82043.1 SusD family protein [Mariniflexile sp. TRM1-10]